MSSLDDSAGDTMIELKGLSEGPVMRELGIDSNEVERRKRHVGLEANDAEQIRKLGPLVERDVNALTDGFFEFLSRIEGTQALLGHPALIEAARRAKREHLLAMVRGDYGIEYLSQRVKLGLIYSQGQVDTRVLLGAFHQLMRQIGFQAMRELDPTSGFEAFMALKKLAFMDIGLIIDVLVLERQRVIRQQQDSIRELSTPVLQLREQLLLLPIIGVIDTIRARMMTESLLRAIRHNRARVVVMDVTGVATIDSRVANHLIQTVSAARLMGAKVIISGLSADVAQSLVQIGVDLAGLNTVGDLQGGIEEAERLLGYQLISGARAEAALSRA